MEENPLQNLLLISLKASLFRPEEVTRMHRSAAHVRANRISGGCSALCFATPRSPLLQRSCEPTCKHATPRSPDFRLALKHSWTLFSSTLSTATPLTQLLSSRTSHAAFFFFFFPSLCSESRWAGVISVAFFEAESLFFYIYIILSLFDVCSRHLWTNTFPFFYY